MRPLARGSLAAQPYLALAGNDSGGLLAYPLARGWSVGVGFSSGDKAGPLGEPVAETASYLAEIRHQWTDGARLAVGAGVLEEDGGLLGTTGDGAFHLDEPVSTRFLALAGELPLAKGWRLFGSVTTGWTDAEGLDTGLMSEVSGIRSTAFGFGLAAEDMLGTGGRLTLTLSQPLKVTAGSARLDVPVGRALDGRVLRQSERASLAPSGSEHDLELGYRLPLRGGGSLSATGLVQFQPGHDADAAPDYGMAVRYRVPF